MAKVHYAKRRNSMIGNFWVAQCGLFVDIWKPGTVRALHVSGRAVHLWKRVTCKNCLRVAP